jgi:DNA polymerase III gamma/tau subunit
MDYGGFTSEQLVINFLVCDGDVDRTQREPLLGEGLKKIGVAFGKHNIYRTICVLVTCSEFNNTKDPDDLMVFRDPEEEKTEKERLEKEKIEQERLEKEKAEQEILEKEKAEKEILEKEKAEKEKEEQKALDEEKEKEKKRIEEEKRIKEEAERKKKEEEKKKKEEAERKKKEEEEKKKKEPVKKKYEVTNNNKGETTNIFKLKKKIYAYETVPKDQLPEGVASITKSDTIVIEGGKRYKKIIYNKVMLDGTKKTEEVKTCLDN